TSDSAVYIRLLDFNAGAAEGFKESLDTLIGDTGRNANGIIIDLRGNPGGLFSEARDIAQLFLKMGEFIVGTSSRSKWNEESHIAETDGEYSRLPMAILIDNGSASAAEILAGTLKYSGHAVLVGDTTFGKGLVQSYLRLPEGDGLRLTISRYFFEGNRYINPLDSAAKVQGVGIAPDIFYKSIEDEPFYLELEWKLILLRFAHLRQDDIVSSTGSPEEKNRWLNLLREYAFKNKFSYKSETAKSAEKLFEEVESAALKKQAQKALKIAELLDEKLFEKFGDYLWLRLRQIAYERKYGSYKAYKEIVVPNNEPIKIASSALHQKEVQ
ncbi:MAG TPA: S41 family peptidase, partial [candidate division Zixibacteria bacterium]|nr:S41 family peptidase [candidate division Zixibacteria bacterium]